jgi:hypothetical protein
MNCFARTAAPVLKKYITDGIHSRGMKLGEPSRVFLGGYVAGRNKKKNILL